MLSHDLIVKPARFWIGEARWDHPLAIIDLDATDAWPASCAMPPCPVIGVGRRDGPGAEQVDAVIEAPTTFEGVLSQIEANPLAAAAVVQLLRLLPSLSLEQGLVAESQAYAMLQGSAEHLAWQRRNRAGEGSTPGTVRTLRIDEMLEVVLDRRDQDNAIDRPMRDALYEAFQLAALDPSIDRVVLRGEGKAFSLGADLSEFGTTGDPATAHAIRAATLPAHMALRIADRLEARVQGACVGSGLELAAFAGRVVAGPKAWFQLPELAMGVLPGAGGCVSLTRRIGRQRTALMILSGKRISARTALEWGLVDAIVNDLA
jgi:enoyl-CoA hydratase/carnithine racemase